MLALALLALAPPSGAGAFQVYPEIYKDVTGIHHIELASPDIYDFSHDTDEVDGEYTFKMAVIHEADGTLVGEGHDYGNGLAIRYEYDGKVKKVRGVTTVQDELRSAGSLGSGDPKEYTASSKFKGEIQGFDEEARLVGVTRTKSCIRIQNPILNRTEKICATSVVDVDRDYGNRGRWAVTMLIERSGKTLIGNGKIYIDDYGDEITFFPVTLDGTVKPDGRATIKLEPVYPTGLGKVTIYGVLVGGEPGGDTPTLTAVHRVKGKILGQKFDEGY
jgi:hypothetical protein